MNIETINFINTVNITIFIIFTVLYLYQIYYICIVLIGKKSKIQNISKLHKFAIIIAARNESSVIGNLINNIKSQNYPKELLDVYVVADNCTDNTAEIARKYGAHVYERFNKQKIGKGYALDFLFNKITKHYDGYFIFDADNLLDPNYVLEMNKVFGNDYNIVTSYRNSKNYDSNWISAGYSLWFLREATYLNNARMILGTSCAVSGTGFLVSSKIILKNKGWIHHLLTEDIEFTIDSVINGERIGYCGTAEFYDEQPITMKTSWNQRLRWSKGFYQVFFKYCSRLLKSIFKKHNFASYDMFMTIAPAMIISILTLLFNIFFLLKAIIENDTQITMITLHTICNSLFNYYGILYIIGAITTITEWNKIKASNYKKILYTFTFPIFIFTYIPISIVALFKKVDWKPIPHIIKKNI